ncbi:MAG: EamA family transporter [Betaproteobacteria bacterium]|nr:EamA family transporter [Betaproteobacteria bacterium]
MHWFPLALVCALSLALADTATKKWLADRSAGELTLIRFGLPGLLLLPVFLSLGLPAPPPAFWGWLAAAMPLEILAMLLYVRAIRDHPLSATLPYVAFTPVFTALTGWLLLGETLSGTGLAGVVLVTAGAWGLNLRHAGRHPRTWLAPFAAMLRQTGSRLMLAVAAIYSVTAVLGKGALGLVPGHALAFGALYFVLLGGLTLLFFGLRRPALIGRALAGGARVWAVAGLMAAMVLTHFLALAQTETAYMIAVKRLSVLFGILLGAWVFREARLAGNLAAGALMLAGVALIVG